MPPRAGTTLPLRSGAGAWPQVYRRGGSAPRRQESTSSWVTCGKLSNAGATATYGSGVSRTTTSSTARPSRSASPAGPTGTASTTRPAPTRRHQRAAATQPQPLGGLVVDRLDAVGDRADGQLGVVGRGQLARHHHVERRAEAAGDAGRHDHPAAGNGQDRERPDDALP